MKTFEDALLTLIIVSLVFIVGNLHKRLKKLEETKN